MAKNALARLVRLEFAPPHYLAPSLAGIAVSASGVKLAVLKERLGGLELVGFGEARLSLDAVKDGEIVDRAGIVEAVRALAREHKVRFANIALPEAKSYLFETGVASDDAEIVRSQLAEHLEEFVPLPSAEVAFDTVAAGPGHSMGVAYARRVIDESLSVFDEAGVVARSVESEVFSMARSLLPYGSTETVFIIDIGRTTTKLVIVSRGVPRFATTLDIGGHSLTTALEKRFEISEEQAVKLKNEQGLVRTSENGEYLEAVLATTSVIREEVSRRLEYWQSQVGDGKHEPVTRAILVGGNATLKGLAEYLESALKVPVALGDVFTNLRPRDHWLPPLEYLESLGYASAIGLALRDYDA